MEWWSIFLNIEHRTPNTEHRTPNTEHRTPNTEHRTMIGQRSNDIRILHVITRMVKGGAQENTLATVLGIDGRRWESSLAAGPALGPEGSLEPECRRAGVRMLGMSELVREVSPWQDGIALRQLI